MSEYIKEMEFPSRSKMLFWRNAKKCKRLKCKRYILFHFFLFCLLLSDLGQDQLSKVIGSLAFKETPPLGYA